HLEHGLAEVEASIACLQNESVSAKAVADGLRRFSDLYACLKPFEQKELMHLVLRRAEVKDDQIVLEINANVPTVVAGTFNERASRSVTPNWLPGQDSNLRHAD